MIPYVLVIAGVLVHALRFKRDETHTDTIICMRFVPDGSGDVLSPKKAANSGSSRSALYRAAREGRLQRIARGVYVRADAPPGDWDWIEAAARKPQATICLVSALAYHDLTDTIPGALDVAIPRGSRIPAGASAIRWHAFDRGTFELGRDVIPVPWVSMTIGMYSPERSIADAFRLRGEVGYEIGRDALREWLRRGGKPTALTTVASQLPRAKGPLLRALESLA